MFSFFVSFFTGILAALNPCTVPIYPLVFSYYLKRDDKVSWKNVVLFGLGFLMAFLILTLVFVLIGSTSVQEFVRFLAAGVLALLGIHFILKGIDGSWLEGHIAKIENPLVFGAVFGLALNPCALPLFITTLAITSIDAFHFLHIVFFGLGVAFPPIVAAIFGTAIIRKLATRVRGIYNYMNKVVGIFLLIAAAFLVYFVAATPTIALVSSLLILLFFVLLILPFWKHIYKKKKRAPLFILTTFLLLLWAVLTFHCYRVSYTTQFVCNSSCPPCQLCVGLLLGVLLLGYAGFYYLEKN